MDKKIVLVFPGQGSQNPGMGKDFYENFSIVQELFEQASDILSLDMKKILFNFTKEELGKTENSQIAIYLVSSAILQVLNKEIPEIVPVICTGLSLGEYSALYAVGVLSFRDGLILVRKRALYMAEACKNNPGSMVAIIGLEVEDIEKELEKDVWIANFNTPRQSVISGNKEKVKKTEERLKKKGAKIMILDVQGAFHTPFMKSAQKKLKEEIEHVKFKDYKSRIVMNMTGDFVTDKELIKENLIKQVTSGVKWWQGIKNIEKEGPEMYLEVGYGRTLNGMNRKMNLITPTISLNSVENFKSLEKEIDELIKK